VRLLLVRIVLALAFTMCVTCRTHRLGGVAENDQDPLAPLHVFEDTTRAQTDFAHQETSSTALGADPYVIRPVVAREGDSPASPHFVGLLRGRSVVVELDATLHEVARLPAPESPTGLAVAANGDVFVVGELASRVDRYRRVGGALKPAGSIELPGVRAMRDVATGPEGVVYVVEEHDGRLLTLRPRAAAGALLPAARADSSPCHEPVHVMRTAHALLVDCFLDHAIVVRKVDGRGFPMLEGEIRLAQDGPIWGFDAREETGALLVAVGGVEDHPLDRTEGSFGFVDSFITLYRVADGAAVKLSAVNTSALGLVTPKSLKLTRSTTGVLDLAVAGYASSQMALLHWNGAAALENVSALAEPTIKMRPVPPGNAMMDLFADGSFVFANPLIDAWVLTTGDTNAIVHVDDERSRARSADSRLGEALFFTTLMAPWDKSEDRLSRFTCETCHWEGYVDGRTHHTGRADVHATTKPLLGLFNNRPHFSRALDPDMTTMVNNEFRVANAKSDHDPWFSLSASDFPWVKELAISDATLGPERLRRALMTFLMDFTHRPNPSVIGRTQWTGSEQQGARVFRDNCESCHEARLIADDATTRLPFEAWEERVMSREGPIVWAHADYERTGVVPYVNEKGARVVSLRRLYKKYPYFTNGSAKSIRSVLDRVGFAGSGFFHDGAPQGASRLREEEKAELAEFLDLL
jgi:hypothetical protein